MITTKHRCKKLGIEFNIDLNDVIIPEFCPALGLKLIPGDGKFSDCSPSIDRIDPSKGYVKGNVQIISYKANRIKNDATVDEVRKVADFMAKLHLN